jgi:hypothetical protein
MNADGTNVKTLDAKQEESRNVFFQYSIEFFAPLRLCVEGFAKSCEPGKPPAAGCV